MMEKRVLVAILLSFVVLYVYQSLVVKPVPRPAAGASDGAASTTGSSTPASAAQPAPGTRTPPTPAAMPAATALVGDTSEHDVRVETRDVIAVFTSRGARLKSWRLKHYLDAKNEPLELIAYELSDTQPLPFSLRVDEEAVTATLNGALYAVTGAPAGTGAISAPVDLRFEYRDSAGVQAVKQFHLDPASYIVAFRATVSLGDRALAPVIQWGPAVGDAATEVSRYTKKAEGLLSLSGKVQRLAQKDIAKQAVYEGDFAYAGVDDQYFMAAALFTGAAKLTYQPLSIPPPEGSKDQPREFVSFGIEPIRSDAPLKFFAGPKDFDVLAAIDQQFVRAIDFGMFAVLVMPLLQSLKWINGYVGNYGWAIIFLTIIINAFMFPLRHKSVVSMRKMQEIQPEVKAIQDRYAKLKTTDPARQKMNQERWRSTRSAA